MSEHKSMPSKRPWREYLQLRVFPLEGFPYRSPMASIPLVACVTSRVGELEILDRIDLRSLALEAEDGSVVAGAFGIHTLGRFTDFIEISPVRPKLKFVDLFDLDQDAVLGPGVYMLRLTARVFVQEGERLDDVELSAEAELKVT